MAALDRMATGLLDVLGAGDDVEEGEGDLQSVGIGTEEVEAELSWNRGVSVDGEGPVEGRPC